MTEQQLSRRAFLRGTGDLARGSCIVLSLPMILISCERSKEARLNSEDFHTLSIEEAREFHAMAARIIPSDETPGASEAGVIYFMDNVLGDGRDEELGILRTGLAELQSAAATLGSDNFHQLEPSQQDQLLRAIEDTRFFNTVRYLTVAGMFALPEYGGNGDNIGHELLGFEDRHAWQAPYGYYDAEYAEKGV